MPELDGFELAAMIRQHPRCRRTAIIFVSAVHLTDLDRVQGLRDRRGRLRVGAGRAGDPAREDRRLRRPLPQDARARAPQPHAGGARARRGPAELAGHDRAAARARAPAAPAGRGARRGGPAQDRVPRDARARAAQSAAADPRRRSSSCARPRRRIDQLQWARDVIDRQVNQLVRLVDDLLDASRISSGKLELRKDIVDFVPIVAGAVESNRPLAERKHQHIEVSLPSEPGLRRRRRRAADAGRPEPPQQRGEVQPERRAHLARGRRPRRQRRDAHSRRGHRHRAKPTCRACSRCSTRATPTPTTRRAASGSASRSCVSWSTCTAAAWKRTARVPAKAASSWCGCPRSRASATRRSRSPRPAAADDAAPSRRILVVDDNRDAAETLAMMLRLEGNEVDTAFDGEGAIAATAHLPSRRRADGPRHAEARRL